MKKLVAIIFLVLFSNKQQAQSKMDWDVSHYGINLYQRGSVKYNLGDSSYSKIGKPNHLMCSFYGINPDAGWWLYGDASGFLLGAIGLSKGSVAKDLHYSLYELGAGWSFNNKRPIKLGGFAELKIVMGLALGGRYFRTINQGSYLSEMGIFPLEFGSMINIKERVLVLAKFGLQPLYDGKPKGGRFYYDIRSSMKLGRRFGLSLTLMRNTYRYSYDVQVSGPNGTSVTQKFKETYRFFTTQFGIVFITGEGGGKKSRDR
jgi:hypothetical protein